MGIVPACSPPCVCYRMPPCLLLTFVHFEPRRAQAIGSHQRLRRGPGGSWRIARSLIFSEPSQAACRNAQPRTAWSPRDHRCDGAAPHIRSQIAPPAASPSRNSRTHSTATSPCRSAGIFCATVAVMPSIRAPASIWGRRHSRWPSSSARQGSLVDRESRRRLPRFGPINFSRSGNMRSDATAVGLPSPGRDGVERAAGTVLCSRAALSNLTTGAVTVGVALTATAACFAEREHPIHHISQNYVTILQQEMYTRCADVGVAVRFQSCANPDAHRSAAPLPDIPDCQLTNFDP